MDKSDGHRMERLSLQSLYRAVFSGSAIQFVPQKRKSHAGHMDADLVCPSCLQLKLHIGIFFKTLQNPVMGCGRFPVFGVYSHFFALCGVTSDIPVNSAGIVLYNAADDASVSARDRMFLIWRAISTCARSFLQTIRLPVVSLSMRWTIPGRISPLIPDRLSRQ